MVGNDRITDNGTVRISEEQIELQYRYMRSVREITGGNKKAHVRTYGCQQNEADSELLSGMLVEMGYALTDSTEEADLILINTCAVREHAELKALSVAGQFKHLKEAKPGLLIGMCGCMASQECRKEDVKRKYPYVDFLFATDRLWCFPEILSNALSTGKRQFYSDGNIRGNIAEGLPVHRNGSFKAWLSIMYGCNNFCTYCIVPYVRGRERSRMPEDILNEARALVKSGYKEITLLGQNVNSYGAGLDTECDFSDILGEICSLEGDFTVRFMTSHPKDASRKLIDTMASSPKAARHFHLPLQSGSDEILRRMNRHYDCESYSALLGYMREKMPDISVTSDIIVGFPGETEEQFCGTLDMLKLARFDNIYSFIYSPRPGTPAAGYPDQVPDSVKTERFSRLLEVQQQISLEKNRALLGKTLRVLVEGKSKTDASKLTGRTGGNRLVHFEGPEELIGNFADVIVTDADTYVLSGTLK